MSTDCPFFSLISISDHFPGWGALYLCAQGCGNFRVAAAGVGPELRGAAGHCWSTWGCVCQCVSPASFRLDWPNSRSTSPRGCRVKVCSSWSAAVGTRVPGPRSWAGQGTRTAPGEPTCRSPAGWGIRIGRMCVYIPTDRPSFWRRKTSILTQTGGRDEAAGAVSDCMSAARPVCVDLAAACVYMYVCAAYTHLCVSLSGRCVQPHRWPDLGVGSCSRASRFSNP